MDKQYDHQEGFFFNRLMNDFEPKALRLIKHFLAALRIIFNRLVRYINFLLFLVTHSTSVLFFVLVISTRVSDSGSSSASTFSEIFTKAHFVVKHTPRSNRASKFNFLCKIQKKTIAILGKDADILKT